MEQFENEMLDSLYEIREGEVEKQYKAKYGEIEYTERTNNAENELVNFMKKFIKNKEDMENLYGKLNKFELCAMREMCFWYRPYYKAGFIDGINLRKEIKESILKNDKLDKKMQEESFFYKYIDSIMQFLEDNRFNIWRKQEKYKEITDKMINIKNKYPNVRTFIDDRTVIELTREELNAVLEYIDLNNRIETIEKIETFKLGIKEGKIL